MTGFHGLLALTDRATGKAMTVTLWNSEAEMRQSEDAANRLRANAAAESGTRVLSVDRFEVVVNTTTAATA
jgi:heme-degrading monooxygenase HmoA